MDDLFTAPDRQHPVTVSELNRRARQLLEQGLPRVWVEGEISNLARPASGHVYFSLKDADAQIRCAWFRQRQRGPTLRLRDGDRMLACGKVSVYEARGDYQLIVEQLEPAGEGELRRRFEQLKQKLAAEGLFEQDRKRPLPALPRRIGVITSPSGAAVRDILTVLARRFPAVPVVIYPAAVQGAAAVPELVAAIDAAVRRGECDVLIVGRGGGSLEDLWAFNEEPLARAISACPIPVISAVGHEVDVTIADFVADVRAPTPSGAAELVVPDGAEWRRAFERLRVRLAALARRALEDRGQRLDWLAQRLAVSSPLATVRRQRDRLAALTRALARAARAGLDRRGRRLERLQARLAARSPVGRVREAAAARAHLSGRLVAAMERRLERTRHRHALAARSLHAVGPQRTLERGYAIVTDKASGALLTDAAVVATGTRIEARLARGSIEAEVTARREAGDAD